MTLPDAVYVPPVNSTRLLLEAGEDWVPTTETTGTPVPAKEKRLVGLGRELQATTTISTANATGWQYPARPELWWVKNVTWPDTITHAYFAANRGSPAREALVIFKQFSQTTSTTTTTSTSTTTTTTPASTCPHFEIEKHPDWATKGWEFMANETDYRAFRCQLPAFAPPNVIVHVRCNRITEDWERTRLPEGMDPLIPENLEYAEICRPAKDCMGETDLIPLAAGKKLSTWCTADENAVRRQLRGDMWGDNTAFLPPRLSKTERSLDGEERELQHVVRQLQVSSTNNATANVSFQPNGEICVLECLPNANLTMDAFCRDKAYIVDTTHLKHPR